MTDGQPIGIVLSNDRYACILEQCSATFARLSDLKRHDNTQHKKTLVFYCRQTGCRRSEPTAGSVSKPFARKDKRDEHEWRVHQRRQMSVDQGLRASNLVM